LTNSTLGLAYLKIDFIPTEEYTAEDSKEARDDATWIVSLAKQVIDLPGSEKNG
jgi:hypothetical protein